jgi:hypothetical protein
MNDDLFKNLQISDIEEIFKEDDYQTVSFINSHEHEDLNRMNFQEQDAEAITPPDLDSANMDI